MSKMFPKILLKLYEKFLLFRMSKKHISNNNDETEFLTKNYLNYSSRPIQMDLKFDIDKDMGGETLLVVIPFRDHAKMTDVCVQGLLKQKTTRLKLRICLVDNGSKEEETKKWLQKTLKDHKDQVALIRDDSPFNFSKLNNRAVKEAGKTDYILFLNNDIEFLSSGDIARLVSAYSEIPNIGALGCTLLYPDRRIQHLFAAPGVKIVAAHPLKGIPYSPHDQWFNGVRLVPAITGACLMVSSELFAEVGGFDENLPRHGQDIDLCLKIQKAGFDNWTDTRTVLIHHESYSRKTDIDKKEVSYMYNKWGEYLTCNPYFNSKISRWSEYPVLRYFEGRYPWKWLL